MRVQLLAMEFADDGDGPTPTTVTLKMGIADAAMIAGVCGQMRGVEQLRTQTDSELWDVLTGGVFNAYWDDGVDGALRQLGARRLTLRKEDT